MGLVDSQQLERLVVRGKSGCLARCANWIYDGIGRVIVRTHEDLSQAQARYILYYDGRFEADEN